MSRRLAGRLLLSVGASAGILLAFEGAVRLIAPRPWYEVLEDEQFHNQGFPYQLNRWKLRDQEYDVPAPAGTHRILFLGDSFTFGTGVLDRSKLFVELLESRFNADPPDPSVERYEILNAGIPGSLTSDWIQTLLGPGREFRPQTIVTVFFLRDGTTLGLRKNLFNPMRYEMLQWRENSFWARHSAAWRYLRGRFQAQEASRQYVESFHEQYFGAAEQTSEWQLAQKNLSWLAEQAEIGSLGFHLVVFPVLFGLGPDYPFRQICQAVEQFGRDHDIPTFSLLPALDNEDAEALWVSDLDQHPNETGHALVADALEAYLRPQLTPPTSSDGNTR